MNPPRALLVVLVLTALAVATSTAVRLGGSRSASSPGPARAVTVRHHTPASRTPVAVLDAWDVRRAAAWSRGDPAGLRSLYVPGSAAGRADVRMLRAWLARGLRVRAMRTQVLGARLVTRTADRIVLRVTDRLARAVATGGGAVVRLPNDGPSTRTVVLRRRAGEWRVVEVRERGQPAR